MLPMLPRAGGEPEIAKREMAEALAALLPDSPAPVAPADRLAEALMELEAIAGRLRRMERVLPRRLAARTGILAASVERGMEVAFAELAPKTRS